MTITECDFCGKTNKSVNDLRIEYGDEIDLILYDICEDCWKKVKKEFMDSMINWGKGDSPELREAKEIREKATSEEINLEELCNRKFDNEVFIPQEPTTEEKDEMVKRIKKEGVKIMKCDKCINKLGVRIDGVITIYCGHIWEFKKHPDSITSESIVKKEGAIYANFEDVEECTSFQKLDS